MFSPSKMGEKSLNLFKDACSIAWLQVLSFWKSVKRAHSIISFLFIQCTQYIIINSLQNWISSPRNNFHPRLFVVLDRKAQQYLFRLIYSITCSIRLLYQIRHQGNCYSLVAVFNRKIYITYSKKRPFNLIVSNASIWWIPWSSTPKIAKRLKNSHSGVKIKPFQRIKSLNLVKDIWGASYNISSSN